MTTLKEMVEWQEIMQYDDIEIIKSWFIQNNAESEGISIITELAQAQLLKVQNKLDYAQTWLPYLPDLEKVNDGLTHEQAQKLQLVITIFLLGMDLKDMSVYDWATTEIPKIKRPRIMFVPCVKWLEEKYRIKFKGE
jgi:hypothetical protein